MSEVTPRDREEKLLAAIADGTTDKLPTPRNRKEKLLKEIYNKGLNVAQLLDDINGEVV